MAHPREEIEQQLRSHGEQRRQSLAAADEALDQIAQLIPKALAAGLTKSEIHRITGISRPTIDSLLHDR